MEPQIASASLLRKRQALLKHLSAVEPLLDGSLVTIYKTCGNPSCKCAKGAKHKGLYLTYKGQRKEPGKAAKTKTLYVPVALEAEVRKWSQECAKARELIRQISEVQRDIIRAYVAEHGRGRKKKGKTK
jgi:hypothetical protein